MKKLIITILFALSFSSFAQDNDPLNSMPLNKMFWSLFQERNIIGQNDCSNKCGRYVRALRAQGHEADIVVIQPYTTRYPHAIVALNENGKITYLDPTRGTIGYDLENLGRKIKTITHTELDSLGEQYR